MIDMVKVKDLKLNMTLSTDGLIIKELRYHKVYEVDGELHGQVTVGGVCHGIWKEAHFRLNDELPVYHDDTNGGED